MPDSVNAPGSRFRHQARQVLAWSACVLWLISLFAPTLNETNGLQIALVTVILGWAWLPHGPWAVLSNWTIPWACVHLIKGGRPRLSTGLSVLFPVTSAWYWKLLGDASYASWGIYAWSAAIMMTVLATLLAKERPRRCATIEPAPACPDQTDA